MTAIAFSTSMIGDDASAITNIFEISIVVSGKHTLIIKRQDTSGISTLISSDGAIVFEPTEKTECLKSVFTAEDLSNIPDKETAHTHPFQR